MDASTGWFRDEFSKIDFGDQRLNDRFLRTGKMLSEQPEAPINKASRFAFKFSQKDVGNSQF